MEDSRIKNAMERLETLEKDNENLRHQLEEQETFGRAVATAIENFESRIGQLEEVARANGKNVEELGTQVTTCLTGLRKLAEERVDELAGRMSPGGSS